MSTEYQFPLPLVVKALKQRIDNINLKFLNFQTLAECKTLCTKIVLTYRYVIYIHMVSATNNSTICPVFVVKKNPL